MTSEDSNFHNDNRLKRFLTWLERCSLAIEAPINRWVRSPEFNPLYHTGPLAVFLTLIIIVTGIYLTMFYPFGFEASYLAVGKIESNLIGRVVRALHRYASDALFIVALLHGWRTFFMDRFRGPRWLAWVSGIVMGGLIWLAGITGYWLVMDVRANLLNETLMRLIGNWRAGVAFIIRTLMPSEGNTGWVFVLILITVHVGITAIGGLFYWLHIKRLSRPKHLPPQHWLLLSGILLTGVALFVPLGMLPKWELTQLPSKLDIDLFYLFYLPAALKWPAGGLWAGALIAFSLVGLLPWLLRGKLLSPIVVDTERCTGCTLCAADCPYNAIHMVGREDGKQHKYVARVDTKMCVACGVCIGSCQPVALSLDSYAKDVRLDELVQHVLAESEAPVKLVFTCARHAYQSGLLPQQKDEGQIVREVDGHDKTLVIPLTCIAMAHPSLAERGIKAGAAQVQFIGCPPEDCANREGNLWQERRMERKRLPKLHLAYLNSPIQLSWTSPDQFRKALVSVTSYARASAYEFRISKQSWRSLIPAGLLLMVVMVVMVVLSRIPYNFYRGGQAMIDVQLDHQIGLPIEGAISGLAVEKGEGNSIRLVLEVNGQEVVEQNYQNLNAETKTPIWGRAWLIPGNALVRLLLYESAGQSNPQVLYDQTVRLHPGEVLPLHFTDIKQSGNAKAGERIFYGGTAETRAGCAICHSLEPNVNVVGPSLAGIAGHAAERVPGISGEDYLEQSILEPDAYLVEGFTGGRMPSNYGEILSDEQVKDLVAFLATLK